MESTENQATLNTQHRRLGEHLLAQNVLTPEQLDEAIEYQCIYGGKLGTSLIELGFVDENQLARALSQQLKLHYIKPERLMDIPASLLDLVPRDIALKHLIVPYHKNGQKLYVAMNEVSNLSNIDDLSFQLDHIIVPLAIPEIRLMLALKHHYGMVLSPRFETLAVQINRRMLAARKVSSQAATSAKTATDHISDESIPQPLSEVKYSDNEKTEQGKATEQTSTPEEAPLESLLQQLAEAGERDDIARAMVNYIRTLFPDCALFMVRDNKVTGWLASRKEISQDFEQIEIPLDKSSLFNPALTTPYYLGPVIDSAQNRKILRIFQSTLPQNVLIMPLMVRKRLVSFLYIQGEIEKLEHHLNAIGALVSKAELAFNILILKNKILNA